VLLTVIGVLAAIGFCLLWVYGIFTGFRDGIIRKRIRVPGRDDQDQFLEGAQAKLWGWVLVITGSLILGALFWALVRPYLDLM
jgi:hypothetical protein